MRLRAAFWGLLRARWLAWGVACAGCAPGAFDDLGGPEEQSEGPVECEGEPASCMPEADAEAEAETEPEAGTEPESETEPETGTEPETEADAAVCSSCDGDAAMCVACDAGADAAVCSLDAAQCGVDAGGCAAPVCSPGQQQSEKRACGACNTGSQTRTRKCAADGCSWGAWSAFGACGGVTAACSPGQTTGCANGDECGQRVCSESCAWGACAPKVAGGCLRIREGHTDQGSNYRCCNGTGHWQFCLPDCRWSTDCSACSEGAPNFCSDCY